MRIALISDIHANLVALEAVLADIGRHAPDCVLSLGDQVNLGPNPREVLQLLKSENVTCLHGNHERYILSEMAGDPGYQGANFNCLRFQKQFVTAEDITLPRALTLEGVTFCHALPEDDRFPVFDPARALPLLREMAFPERTRIFCGHGHNPVSYSVGNLQLHCIGSAGCMDDGVPCTAPYVILDIEGEALVTRHYSVAYDARRMREQFLQSGIASFCPIMAHIVCLQMTRNRDYLMQFVPLAQRISAERGETRISEESWVEADRRFGWPDGVDTKAFWAGCV